MDNQPKYEQSATNCPVCLEVFSQPKSLPCLHTICETCVAIYVKSMQKAFSRTQKGLHVENGFNCPICKTAVPCDDPDPRNWARNLPDNTMILALMEKKKLRLKSEECSACKSRGELVRAGAWCSECQEALCTKCSNYHRSNNALKHHHIFKVEDLEKDPNLIQFTEEEKCGKHCDKKLEMYCKEHDSLCCIFCLTSGHKQCVNIIPIDEAAQGIREKSEIKCVQDQLKHMNCEIRGIVQDRQKNIDDFMQQQQRISNDISTFRFKVNQHLDQLEEKLKKSMDLVYNENMTEMNSQVECLQNREKAIKNCQKIFQTTLKHGSDLKIFLEINKIKKQIHTHETHLKKQKSSMKRVDLKFLMSTPANQFNRYLTTLGEVDISSSPYPNIETPYTSHVASPIHTSRSSIIVDLESSMQSNHHDRYVPDQWESTRPSNGSDEYHQLLSKSDMIAVSEADLSKTVYINKTVIADVEYLPNGKIILVISNPNNWRLHIYDKNGSIEKEIRLCSPPGALAVLNKQESAITFPEKQIIQFMDNETYSMAKDMRIRGSCRQICSANKKMVVICESDVKLLVGTSVRTLSINGSNIQCIRMSCQDRLYYTVQSDSNLYCVSLNGKEQYQYNHGDLVCPYGVALEQRERFVFVSGYKSQNLHQLTPECRLMKIIVTRGEVMSGPQILSLAPSGDEFLQIWEQMYGNFIYIYKMPN